MEGTKEVVSAGEDIGTGSSKHAGVGEMFKGGGTCGHSLWVRDVGYEPHHGPGSAGVP